MVKRELRKAAKQLSARGSSSGGEARAARLDSIERSRIARAGGLEKSGRLVRVHFVKLTCRDSRFVGGSLRGECVVDLFVSRKVGPDDRDPYDSQLECRATIPGELDDPRGGPCEIQIRSGGESVHGEPSVVHSGRKWPKWIDREKLEAAVRDYRQFVLRERVLPHPTLGRPGVEEAPERAGYAGTLELTVLRRFDFALGGEGWAVVGWR